MRANSPQLRLVFLATSLCALAGCRGTRMPQLANPGSAGYQRYNALQNDPYPLDDVAPNVTSTRPKEYDRPIPEVKRARMNTTPPTAAPVVPSFGPAVSPVITAPPAMPQAARNVRPPY